MSIVQVTFGIHPNWDALLPPNTNPGIIIDTGVTYDELATQFPQFAFYIDNTRGLVGYFDPYHLGYVEWTPPAGPNLFTNYSPTYAPPLPPPPPPPSPPPIPAVPEPAHLALLLTGMLVLLSSSMRARLRRKLGAALADLRTR